MRYAIPALVILAFCLGPSQAGARSCSAFAVIKSYDAASKTVEVEFERGRMNKYFPRPEGSPTDSNKVPSSCKSKVKRNTSLVVKPTGGRMSITQVRSNFEGKMLNDTDDETWVPKKLKELIESKTEVVIVVRPGVGKDELPTITTLYLPITDEELAEIERIEKQAEDVS